MALDSEYISSHHDRHYSDRDRDRDRDRSRDRERRHSRDRDRHYSRRHSRSRSPRDRSRDRDRDWSRERDWSRDRDRDRDHSSSRRKRHSRSRSRSKSPFERDERRDKKRRTEEDAYAFVDSAPSAPSRIDYDKYDEIPVETSGRHVPKPIEHFSDIDLGRILLDNIKYAGYAKPTPVQKHSISIVMHDRDLMACAQTGSGKTAAFLFPIISKLAQSPDSLAPSSYHGKAYPLALILAPTRELACQILDEAKKFTRKTLLKCSVVYGGASIGPQLRSIEYGCDILVATPGRLKDIMERGKVFLSRIRFLVLDEADRMLDMGFEPQIRHIVEEKDMPKKGHRRTLMFSATFPKEIQQLAASFLDDYVFLAVGRVGSTTELVTQKFIKTEEHEKQRALLDLLADSPRGLTLIFVETKKTADFLGRFLVQKGYPATSIHGDRVQKDRTAAIKTFATGQTPYLVATNVAARGLDIDNVTHVINYDMPGDIDDYVHRIGRTGRAGKSGISTSFITPNNANIAPRLLEILDEAHQDIPDWLESMRGGKPKKPKQFGGKFRFGGRDFRTEYGGSGGSRPPYGSNGRGSGSSYSSSSSYHPPSSYSSSSSSSWPPPPSSWSSSSSDSWPPPSEPWPSSSSSSWPSSSSSWPPPSSSSDSWSSSSSSWPSSSSSHSSHPPSSSSSSYKPPLPPPPSYGYGYRSSYPAPPPYGPVPPPPSSSSSYRPPYPPYPPSNGSSKS